MRVLAAPDKFRGTATAAQVAQAVCDAAASAGHSASALPLSDGGEGMVDAFGGADRTDRVTGPLGVPVDAPWRFEAGRALAVIESAAACGLVLAGGAQANDPRAATTRGVGELIAAALRAGARDIVVGLGGSATTDGGAGAVEALAGTDLTGVQIVACCDVDTAFTEAARVFGPQKGADDAAVAELTARLHALREQAIARGGPDLDTIPGTGAAGGLAGGLAVLGAALVPGFATVADRLGLDDALDGCGLVVTGEGRFDATSLRGKVVGGVLGRARVRHVPVLVVAGSVADDVDPGADVPVVDLSARYGRECALADPSACVRDAVAQFLTAGG